MPTGGVILKKMSPPLSATSVDPSRATSVDADELIREEINETKRQFQLQSTLGLSAAENSFGQVRAAPVYESEGHHASRSVTFHSM